MIRSRNGLVFATVCTLGLGFSVACTETVIKTEGPADEPGGTSSGSSGKGASSSSSSSGGSSSGGSSSGGSSSGGSSSGGVNTGLPKPTQLKGGDVILLGLIDDMAIGIVLDQTNTVEAFPIAGGASTVIGTLGQDDDVAVRGGAVALYTNVDAQKIATLSIWTKANGLKKDVTTKARTGIFAASADGSRVAFSVNATATGTDLAVTGSATPAVTGVLTGANAINLASQNCAPSLRFTGTRLFGAYCTGAATDAVAAKLVTVADTATTAQELVANTTDALAIQPVFATDTAGSKVFVLGLTTATPARQARVVTVAATPAIKAVDQDVTDGFLLPDGSALVYLSGGAAKKAALDGATITPAALGPAGVKAVLGTSPTRDKFLFHTLDPAGQAELVDLHVANTAAAGPAVDLVPTAAALPVGFTSTGATVLYLTDPAAGGATLKMKPAAGGAEKVLATKSLGALVPPAGTGVVSMDNLQDMDGFSALDLKFVDATGAPAINGGNPASIAASVPDGEFFFAGKKLVFTSVDKATTGLYVIDLP